MKAFVLLVFLAASAAACAANGDCPAGQVCTAGACVCPPGSYYWVRDGIERCRLCAPGCACPGALAACLGCSAGFFSAAPGATACTVCPRGTTSDAIYNTGCEPDNHATPCANRHGALGQIACRPVPPPQNVTLVAPNGALVGVAQYLPGGPPYVPNEIPPYYDVPVPGEHPRPMIQQSY